MNTRSDERLPRPFHRTRRGGALIALLAALSFVFPMLAQATPSQDDIDQARSEENAAKMSVAQIEVALATATAVAPPCDAASGRPPAVDAQRNDALYRKVIDAWSMRDFVASSGDSGHDHFFDTFGKFHRILFHRPRKVGK